MTNAINVIDVVTAMKVRLTKKILMALNLEINRYTKKTGNWTRKGNSTIKRVYPKRYRTNRFAIRKTAASTPDRSNLFLSFS